MTDEERLQEVTQMLLLVRDNLFKGMSKSIQKLQARSINEVLHLPNYIKTIEPIKKWQSLTHDEVNSWELPDCPTVFEFAQFIEAKIKEKNT